MAADKKRAQSPLMCMEHWPSLLEVANAIFRRVATRKSMRAEQDILEVDDDGGQEQGC